MFQLLKMSITIRGNEYCHPILGYALFYKGFDGVFSSYNSIIIELKKNYYNSSFSSFCIIANLFNGE